MRQVLEHDFNATLSASTHGAVDEEDSGGPSYGSFAILAGFMLLSCFLSWCLVVKGPCLSRRSASTTAPTKGNCAAKRQRGRRHEFEAKLKATTFTVSSFVAAESSSRHPDTPVVDVDDDQESDISSSNEGLTENSRSDIDIEWGDNNEILQLPNAENENYNDNNKTGKMVACQCAICLSPYQVGDFVSWAEAGREDQHDSSTTSKCQHFFHTSCIVEYAKASTCNANHPCTVVKCPMCRQPFVTV